MKNEIPMDYSHSLEILRKNFIEENDALFKKIKESEKLGYFKVNLGQLDQFDMRDFLEVFKLPNFYSLELFQLYEEILYLYHFFKYDDFSINTKNYFKNNTFEKESFLKKIDSAIEIISAKKEIEIHVRELAKKIGINNLNLSNYDDDFISLKQYLKAMESAKNKKLYHYGDEEFLVSKIPINGKGFIEGNLKIDSRIFYTFKSEHIIEMARVSNPGIYLIANIPYKKNVNSGFYILFVTEGDSFLVDNNIHAFRSFLSRNDDKLTERRQEDTFLPWEIISNFLEKESDDKSLLSYSGFSFKIIGDLSTVNHTDIFGLTAFLDTCLYTFTKTDFLKESSIALKASMIDINSQSQSDNSLVTYKPNVPSISSLDLTWKPEKFNLPVENSGDYLIPFLKNIPAEQINLKLTRDELTSLKQVERNLTFQLRKQIAENLEEKIKKDYNKNWKKVREQLQLFIRNKFAENKSYYINKILDDKEYQYKTYKGFGTTDQNKFKSEISLDVKEKILSIYYNHEIIHGIINNPYYSMSERNFHFIAFGYRHKYYPCAGCTKNGILELVLTIKDVQQFIDFFELNPKEIKKLPIQMINYLNQARCLYNGNSILEDLDPVSQINNPWWVYSNEDPKITLSLALCKFCKKKFEK